MSEPTGIAALPGELLVISDTGNHRLDFFAEKGEFLRAIGNEVDWSGADACTTERENEISEGVFELGCRAGRGNGAGSLGEPAGLAVSPTGAITVTDFALHRVSRFDPSGGFLRAFGAGVASGAEAFEVCTALTGCLPGSGETALAGATPHPLGVAEACGGSLFVAESASGLSRVERFGEPGSLRAFCPPPEEPVLPQDPGPTDPGLPPAPPADSAPPALIAPPAAASNAIALGAARRDRRRGTATLAITVPAAGQLTLAGRGVRTVARTLTAAATVAMPVRLFGKARRGLLASGHRRVTATITFVPSGGSARTETRKLTLVKMPPPRRR